MKSVLVLGLGEFGSNIAIRMAELKCEVMVVDTEEEKVNDVLPYVTNGSIGDSTDIDFLKEIGAADYDVCVVALGGLFQSSLETTSLLKELGASFVLSRATNDVQKKFLKMSGADEVVYPEKQMAIRLATKYASDTILDFIQLDSGYSIYELKVPKEWFKKTLLQIDIRKKYNINILTLKRGEKVFMPNISTIFEIDDVVFVIGEIKDIQKCFKI